VQTSAEPDKSCWITPQETEVMQVLDQIGQARQACGVDLDDLIESGREIRGELIKEKYGLTEQTRNAP
jgi:hypothetical protein